MSQPKRLRALRGGLLAGAAALALAGCGEIGNTITAAPGTANTLTVALPTEPGANYVGIYEAQALGYFRQADLNIKFVVPSGSTVTDRLPALESGAVDIAASSEPAVFTARDQNHALVSVAAVIQGPLERNVKVTTTTKSGSGSGSGSGSKSGSSSSSNSKSGSGTSKTPNSGGVPTTTVSYHNVLDTSLLPPSLRNRQALPGYDGLVLVVRKGTIVNHGPLIRRFVQAVARGYRAARADPVRAIQDLIAVNPSLTSRRPQLVGGVQWVLSSTFPAGNHPWGWQTTSEWNAFGNWMSKQNLISNVNAIIDASTNELLAGQGV